MTPAQWERIQSVYHQISELPAAQRETALDRECADDAMVRQEVLGLLKAEVTGELDQVVRRVAYDVASQGHERVGPYRLEREIGRGGMGTVYLGSRDDNEFERKVAIKFLNTGMDRPEYLRRFRQERQILADLEHPNIARLIEGGQSSTGLPYLVMEYVDGKPLFDYCRENRLSRKDTLHLVARICDAVQYAHSNLVVHRDLKPSNILVTAEGVPKLLDFGIAKVLEGGTGDAQSLTSATGQLLTMDYASPEQIQGESISTVSDVYSLGVILYELLASARPFQSGDPGSMAYKVLYLEPAKPSLVARERGLPSVPAELDNVVLKAMAKDPLRRYRSAGALAEDLRRHLSGQPVLAHGDGTWYVVSKFMRRHRIQTALAVIFALAVVALGIQLAVTNDRLAKERDLAIRERINAREVSNFMVELFANSNRESDSGTAITAREILDFGAQRLMRSEVGDPELRANLQMGIGAAYQRLGRWDEARIHLEQALRLIRGLDESGGTILVEVLLEYSNLLDRVGEPAAAEAAAREMVQVARRLRPSRLPLALSTLANSFSHQMKHAEAEQVYREGLALKSEGPSSTIPLKANLAIALFRQGKFDEAHELLTEVRQLVTTHWGHDPFVFALLADTRGNLEGLRGNYSAALEAFADQVRLLKSLNRPADPTLAHAYCGQAETYLRMRDPGAAEGPLAACAAIRAKSVEPDSFDAIAVLQLRGLLDLQQGNPRAAEAKFRYALDVHERNYGKAHATRAKGLRLLGMATAMGGDAAVAEQHFQEALERWRDLGLGEDPEFAELVLEAGKAAMAGGRFAEAEARLRIALQVRERLRVSPGLLDATNVELAKCLHARGRSDEAQNLVKTALQHYRQQQPEVRGQAEEAHELLSRTAPGSRGE